MAVFEDKRKDRKSLTREKNGKKTANQNPLKKSYILFLFGRRDRPCGFDNPLVTSCVSGAQNCGIVQTCPVAERTTVSPRVCRTLKTVVHCKFFGWPWQPSLHFVRVESLEAQERLRLQRQSAKEVTANFLLLQPGGC